MAVLSCISLALYFIPGFSDGNRFYYLPFRLFELIFGGLVGLGATTIKKPTKGIYIITALFLVVFVFWGTVSFSERSIYDIDIVSGLYVGTESLLPKSIVLVAVVLLTCIALHWNQYQSFKGFKAIEVMGKMSYSIFIWHQFILAFYRYYYSSNITLSFVSLFILLCGTLTCITYRYVERIKLDNIRTRIALIVAFVATVSFAYKGYVCAGVVTDVQELEVTKDDARKAMFAEYVDRVYGYDKDFPKDHQKIKVLVIGNSFSRDWVNLLLESKFRDKLYISYIEGFNEKNKNRIHESDVIFYFGYKHRLPQWFWEEKRIETKVWGIGTKNYGLCNGVIYKNRNKKWYHEQTVDYNPNYDIVNSILKKEWEDAYIDLIEIHKNKEGKIPAFTPDNKYISPDCRHWTRAGAKYFSSIVDLDAMFGFLRPQ